MRGYDIISGQRAAGRDAAAQRQPQHPHLQPQPHRQHRAQPAAAERPSGGQIRQDEQIAKMLQAQEYHRAMHPSRVGGGDAHEAREARHRLRDRQLEMALEVNPEAFVSVPMLYVQCELNGVPVKAFVDTGAQMTVMNVKCAQRAGLLPAVDSRFKGVAAGVGMARIAGRVHLATLRFSKKTAVDTSITVLEQAGGPELLLGLDLMRKYSATIDLGRNALVIGGEALPFVNGEQLHANMPA